MTRAEIFLWVLFAATCCQLAFQHPSIKLVVGERTNLLSGLLCFFTLAAAVVCGRRSAINFKSPEFRTSAALALLAGFSGLVSLTPLSSSFRVFVLLASGLGGFWCARILLQTPENQRRFTQLCLWILAGLLFLSFLGYFISGYIEHFIVDRSHPLTNVILLLSFAPLTLLGQKSRSSKVLGLILLSLSYVTLCLSERISVVFIPLGVCLVGALVGTLRWKYFVLLCLVVGLLVTAFHQKIIWHKLSMDYPAYRVENYPFSWSIAKQHPWFGIGLRTPREKFLQDYQVTYPTTTKEQFAQTIHDIVTADNQFLTLMVGLGLPFTLTYLVALGLLLAKLIRMAFKPPPGLFFHPLVLLLPLTMAVVHYQLFDGLLFPQSCWFFHLLLGLIPLRATSPAATEL
jgi:hypothetical protein